MVGGRMPFGRDKSRAWLWLARTELRRALSPVAPAGRDLAYLSAVVGMLIFLVTAVLALHEGLIVNLADSMLGAARPAGIPIYVTADSSVVAQNRGGLFLDLFRNRDRFASVIAAGERGKERPSIVRGGLEWFDFHPIRQVENTDVLFTIPGKQVEPIGWAVSETSPLWQWAEAPKPGPIAHRTLVLSERTFSKVFDVEEYELALRRYLSPVLLDAWKKEYRGTSGRVSRLFVLVPDVVPGRQRAVEFSVRWVSSFPAQHELSLLMSLETFRALTLAKAIAEAKLPWGVLPDDTTAVRLVTLSDDKLSDIARADALTKMAACMSPEGKARVDGDSFKIDPPQPATVLRACSKALGFADAQFTAAEEEDYDSGVRIKAGEISVPCRFLLKGGAVIDRAGGTICHKRADVATLSAFESAVSGLVYAAERRDLPALRNAINDAAISGQPAISISESYRNSLARFDYLLAVLAFVEVPIAIFCAFLVGYVVFFQISTWIGHRQAQYGVLLARGLSWSDLYRLCFFQMILAVGLGALGALALSETCRWILAMVFEGSGAAQMARTQLGILRPELVTVISFRSLTLAAERISITMLDYAIAVLFVGLLAFGLLGLLLRSLPLGRFTSPVSLIVGKGR